MKENEKQNDIKSQLLELMNEIDEKANKYSEDQKKKIQQQLIFEYKFILKNKLEDKNTTIEPCDEKEFNEIYTTFSKDKDIKKSKKVENLRQIAMKLANVSGIKLLSETMKHKKTLTQWFKLYMDDLKMYIDSI